MAMAGTPKSPLEAEVARHYGAGGLVERITAGLAALGVEAARPEDLRPVDEFHIGGAQATEELVRQIALAPGMEVLDIGAGLGGTARHVARTTGAQVTGLDLTPEYVAAARALSAMVGLGEATCFEVGSALDMPFADGRFDAALLLHVGMNIPDKRRLFAEARRVLKPGGVFAVYEVMRTGAGDLAFPVPWAMGPQTSFVGAPGEYREAAQAAGFEITAERQRRAFALDFFARMAERMRAASGPPPLGIHLLMVDSAPAKIANMVANIQAGRIAPVEMVLRARA
jgi:ubiquinone/menaquinone biosynthesis C-methylase UbiE